MSAEILVEESAIHELLGLGKPTAQRAGLSVPVNVRVLNVVPQPDQPLGLQLQVGKWLDARDVERLLRVEARKQDVPLLEAIADQLMGVAGLNPRRKP